MLTPLDIQNKEFRKTLRGYSQEEVDSFLGQVVQEFEKLYRLNRELEEQLADSNSNIERYREMEEVLKKTLVTAQKNTEDQRANTQEECRLMLEKVRLQAQGELQEANERVREIMAEYQNIIQQSRVFRVKFRSFIEAHLKLLDERDLNVAAALDVPAEQAGCFPGNTAQVSGPVHDEERPTGG